MDWYGHLQVLARTTGHARFGFTHGVEVYLFRHEHHWQVLAYLDNSYRLGGDNDGPRLNQYLNRFVDLELVSMGDRL